MQNIELFLLDLNSPFHELLCDWTSGDHLSAFSAAGLSGEREKGGRGKKRRVDEVQGGGGGEEREGVATGKSY